MMDFQGIPAYPSAELTAEKRRADADARQAAAAKDKPTEQPAAPQSLPGKNPFPYQPPSLVARDYSTFQFQAPRSAAMPNQPQAAQQQPGLNPNPGPFFSAGLQAVNANLERIAAQIAGFFFGNRKEKPSDEEKAQRRLNDFFSLDPTGQRKVEQTHQSSLGKGSD